MSFSFEDSSWKISYDDDRFGIEHNITRKNSDIEINPASSDIKKRIDQNTLQKSIYLLDTERKNSTNLVYSRELATQYAIAHGAQEGENGYHEFSYNCTNFISQCLWTGGWVEVAGYYKSNSGWWYSGGWPFYAAYPWHNAQYWYEFTNNTRRGERIYNIWDLWFGDILQYNWTKGYTMDHSAIVSYRSYTGVIYMTQHTPNYEGKPLSDVVAGDVDGDWNYFPWRMYVNYEM
ncbi:hypothetical protein Hgul01_03639 [Herpetosiphon gulosus]|uniref:Putative amidase domain-containing protein n=2 Tax=Herpetosiphon gulosus TaxID=1973496 RepID=A0ABP9X5P3_9CHLR